MPRDPSLSEQSISLSGQLLLAAPALSDDTFDRAVILLAEHSATEGAFGIILNHPADGTVGTLVPNLSASSLSQLPLHHGGPVSTDELTFSSLSWDSKNQLCFLPKISVATAESSLVLDRHLVHATVGHSAWSPGQLENELLRNTWITLKPGPSLFSLPHDRTLWKNLLKQISPYHDLLSHAPKNPAFN